MQQHGSMVANIKLADSPRLCGWGQKVEIKKVWIKLFQNMVMLHIKLSGITNAATL